MNKRKRLIITEYCLKMIPFVLAASLSGAFIVKYVKDEIYEEKFYEDLGEDVAKTKPEFKVEIKVNDQPVMIARSIPEEEIETNIDEEEEILSTDLLDSGYVFKDIDFTSLKDINSDSCAWLEIEGTKIDLPIVQGTDNEYYLHHDIYKEKSKLGAVFVDKRNTNLTETVTELNDFTYVYGHHIKGERVFAQLCNYKSQSYFEKHPYGVLYTADGSVYKLEIFAGVLVDGSDESNVYKEDFTSEKKYDAYIEELKNNSTFTSDVSVDYGDKVISLVTCSYEQTNYRYVLYAKLNKQLILENNENKQLEKVK